MKNTIMFLAILLIVMYHTIARYCDFKWALGLVDNCRCYGGM